MSGQLTLWVAFLAGLLSFISPCVLPLYPSYVTYIAGVSWRDTGQGNRLAIRYRALKYSVFFVLGFSTIFLVLGWSAGLIGHIFIQYKEWVRIIGGIVVIIMGMFIAGWFQPKWLLMEKKLILPGKPVGYLGAWLVGVSFAAGWTPCIGPVLASVLVMAANDPGRAIPLLLCYIIGFSLPLLALAYSLGTLRLIERRAAQISRVSGIVMVGMGLLLLSGSLSTITIWFIRLFGGFTGF